MMATVVRMPEVLTGVTEAAIASWLVSVGDRVSVGTPLAEIETEKAVVEYASEVEGIILELRAEQGVGVAIGDPIVVIGAAGETVDPADESESAESDAEPERLAPVTGDEPASPDAGDEPPVPPAPSAGSPAHVAAPEAPADARIDRRFVSPLVRRLARERGIDLSAVVGSGPHGRIVRRDLEALDDGARSQGEGTRATERASAPASATATSDEEFDEIPVTPMRRAIARRLTESTTTVPHFSLVADCRVDRLLHLRAEANEGAPLRISLNDFVIKAVAGALREVPDANATWGETVIRRHHSVDIALAVAVEGGLVTPVIRDADRLSLSELSATASDLAARARSRRLAQHELEGGTFSVSNLGMYGTQEFCAIINPPHAGILAIGAARPAPVVEDGAIVAGTLMTITLSADHRVMDGALAAQLLAAIVERIENPLRALI